MSHREKIIFLSDKSEESNFQEKIIDREKLWEKIKKVYTTSQEGQRLINQFNLKFFPVFILRNNEIKLGVIGHGALRDALDLRRNRGV